MTRSVTWSREALDDIKEQVRFVALDSVDTALRLEERIRKTGEGLSTFATGHPDRVANTYEKTVSKLPYVIVYELTGHGAVETVVILRFIHASRNWPDEE